MKNNFLSELGYSIAETIKSFFGGIIKLIMFIWLAVWGFLYAVFMGIKRLFRDFTLSFRKRVRTSRQLQQEIRRAKTEGSYAQKKAVLKFASSFLFGEDGVLYTAFNYIMPVISVAFLVCIVKYGSGLEYGISVKYNGNEIGIIHEENEFDKAENEVRKRIVNSDKDGNFSIPATLSLRIISDTDRPVTYTQLANNILSSSDEALTEAYGIYIDDEFIGAVKDKTPVQDALNKKLLAYNVSGNVRDVSYQNKIEYRNGIYLAESVMSEKETIDMLTSSKAHKSVYIAQSGDTPAVICQKYNMDLESFDLLNPELKGTCRTGQMINVVEKESFLPVQYIREINITDFLDYETVEIETSSLSIGKKVRLVKGEMGEKVSHVEVTYVNGTEHSRKVLSSKVTKQPVVEQIGVGTFSARPDDPEILLMGTGEFGWPVNGGWISDTFISDRNHCGLDIAADMGTEIYAAGTGVVVSAGWNPGGYGYVVMIDHLDGHQTVYAHMSAVLVNENQVVAQGQVIGEVGSTGDSTGPHCHFEVRYMGICYDPASYLNTVDTAEDIKKQDNKFSEMFPDILEY